MSTHLTILLWLGIIFVVAASLILFKLLRTKAGSKKRIISWLYSGVLYIWYCTSHICFNIWRIIEALLYEQNKLGHHSQNNSTKMV